MFEPFAVRVRSSDARDCATQGAGMGGIATVNSLRVNGERLWSRLMEMAKIGATSHGGGNPQALTDEDLEGRRLLVRWAEAAGCRARVDAIGNLFIRRPGRDHTLPAVMTG